MPFATSSPRVIPPKMLMKIARTFSSVVITSSAFAIWSAFAPPPMSKKLAGEPPTCCDDVARRHREAGAVGDDADVAVETDVLQALLLGEALAVVELGEVAELVPLGVAKGRRVIEGDLGVERVHPAVGREDERVDLDEVGVAFDVAAVERDEHLGDALLGFGVDLGLARRALEPASMEMPSSGLMCSRAIASGCSSATCSISTPPSAESMQRWRLAARSSVKLA